MGLGIVLVVISNFTVSKKWDCLLFKSRIGRVDNSCTFGYSEFSNFYENTTMPCFKCALILEILDHNHV